MTNETETVLDRRRLRRRLTVWRAAAIAALALFLGYMAFGGDKLSSLAGIKQIARVEISGTIFEDRDQLEMLRKIAKDDNVAALLLYVNSPGGTTTGGEALYEELRKISEKKPVVGQFGTVAASAGYIVGLGTDHIVARGNSITGSVGVIMQWPQVTEMLDKIGVKFRTVRSGENKALPNFVEDPTPASLQVTQEMIDDGFQWFLSLVEKRRKIAPSTLAALKTGRIYSGREAMRLKLIDEIGGEAEAIKWLETKRNITKDLKVVTWKKETQSTFGFSAALSGLATAALGANGDAIARMLSRDGQLGSLGLDGMLSVWHPSKN
ncbi:MAG: signal peptide peptidase SppA [Hyphomicrobiaceae bacterium]